LRTNKTYKDYSSWKKDFDIWKKTPKMKKGPKIGTVVDDAAEKSGFLKKLKIVGKKGTKVLPVIGAVPVAWSLHEALEKGDYQEATLEIIGVIPGVGDVVDAFRLGYELGELATVPIDEALNAPKYEEVPEILQHPVSRGVREVQRSLKKKLQEQSPSQEKPKQKLSPKIPEGFPCS
jgi:hypothetical protein